MTRRRRPWLVLATAWALAALSTVPAGAASAASPVTRVGSVDLHACHLLPGALCGSLTRAWDPSGAVKGTLQVGFALLLPTDQSTPAVGTLVPHEGGPGYSTSGSAAFYSRMYGPLLDHRNLLLVDQRGTGNTVPINCPVLQNLSGSYPRAAAECAASLGTHANLYGAELSADDEAAVVDALGLGPVDLYGDSYGTFFSQVFAGRHPDQVRSIVLDGAYPVVGETAWYPTQGPAMRSSFEKVCARAPACAAIGGSAMARLETLLGRVRAAPLHVSAPGADGKQHRVTVDGPTLVYVAFNATYAPPTYRELDAAVRAALAGDAVPIGRLAAEVLFTGAGGGSPSAYSEGLDAAASCQDYPQLYDMTAPPSTRQAQFAAAVAAQRQSAPDVYGPFTVDEYLASFWEEQDWCLQWPVAGAAQTPGPPQPIAGHYPDVPVLVLSGELDSITTPAEGALVAAEFPRARQVVVANSFHVDAVGDTDGCAQALVRSFVTQPTDPLPQPLLACAATVPPIRATPAFGRSYATTAVLRAGVGQVADDRTRAAATAAATVADLTDRYLQAVGTSGLGLRGGRWTSNGNRTVQFSFTDVRLTADLAVSGTASWDRYAHTVHCSLRLRETDPAGALVRGSVVAGDLIGGWDSNAVGASAHLAGQLGGQPVDVAFDAP